jgi:hypothetical protein
MYFGTKVQSFILPRPSGLGDMHKRDHYFFNPQTLVGETRQQIRYALHTAESLVDFRYKATPYQPTFSALTKHKCFVQIEN